MLVGLECSGNTGSGGGNTVGAGNTGGDDIGGCNTGGGGAVAVNYRMHKVHGR